jgi:signal peptidase I
MIPGFGQAFVCRDWATGCTAFLSSLAMLLIALLGYRTRIADIMVLGILGLSVWSVSTTVIRLRENIPGSRILQSQRVGLILIVVAGYFGTFTLLFTATSVWFSIAQITMDTWSRSIRVGDTVIIRRTDHLERGDIIIGRSFDDFRTIVSGPIIGVPGDRISIRKYIYVNDQPTLTPVPQPMQSAYQDLPIDYQTITLEADQYWIVPVINQNADNLNFDLYMGIVSRQFIWGKATHIINPPSRRQWLGRVPIIRK